MTTVSPAALSDERLRHHFPEAATLAVLDAALIAAEQVLRSEHPTLDDVPFDPEHDVDPALLIAHLILRHADELRDLLHLYAAAVHRAVRCTTDDNVF